jgi:hypothetical protein
MSNRSYVRGQTHRIITAGGYAYDQRPLAYGSRRARDADLIPTRTGSRAQEEPDLGRDQDDGLDEVKAFIKANMDPQAFAKLEQMLSQLGGEEQPPDAGQDPEPPPQYGTRDEPPPFRGMPKTGGTKFGQDSRSRSSYYEMFPDNSSVNISDYGSGVR